MKKAKIIGLGNELRGDDGVGIRAVEELRKIGLKAVNLLSIRDPLSILDHLDEDEDLIILDAAKPSGKPGRIIGLKVEDDLDVELKTISTHSIGLAEVIKLMKILNKRPKSLKILLVEGKDFKHGADLSPEVEESLKKLIGMILEELRGEVAEDSCREL